MISPLLILLDIRCNAVVITRAAVTFLSSSHPQSYTYPRSWAGDVKESWRLWEWSVDFVAYGASLYQASALAQCWRTRQETARDSSEKHVPSEWESSSTTARTSTYPATVSQLAVPIVRTRRAFLILSTQSFALLNTLLFNHRTPASTSSLRHSASPKLSSFSLAPASHFCRHTLPRRLEVNPRLFTTHLSPQSPQLHFLDSSG